MGAIRNFFILLPAACGVPSGKENNYLAERWGRVNELQFDCEVANEFSVFAEVAGESISGRLQTAFGWAGLRPENAAIELYAMKLASLIALSDAVDNHGRKDLEDQRNALAGELALQEEHYPAVASLMSVSDASVAPLSGWS